MYQFKIVLLESKPPIWRRIQVKDGTLDDLHSHIQTAMGWTNSHLHRFRVGEARYGDVELLNDGFLDDDLLIDSFKTKISDIVGGRRKGFRFLYEYDFGDGSAHGIEFEGQFDADPRVKYPLCIEGQRACPPEDCGGVWGYAHLLHVLASPRLEEYADLVEWAGVLDPEEFSPKEASKEMKRGIPDWRS